MEPLAVRLGLLGTDRPDHLDRRDLAGDDQILRPGPAPDR